MKSAERTVLFAFAVGLGLYVAWVVRTALLVIYISIVFAIVLSPAVDRVQRLSIRKWHPGRAVSILLIVLGTVLGVTVFLLFALPPVIGDIHQLITNLPQRLQQFRARMQGIPFLRNIDVSALARYAGSLVPGVTGLVGNVAGAVASVASVVVLTAYLILEGNSIFRHAMSVFPPDTAARLTRILTGAADRMSRWLTGQMMLMVILGTASAIVFGALGIRYFYLLAVFAGVANIIPLLGPVLTVILASIVAAVDSLAKVIGVIVFYLAYQQVESAFLTPRIMKTQVELSGTAVLIALLIGGELAGVPGALVAVPSAVLATSLMNEYLVR